MTLLGDLGSKGAMEDGRELRLEVEKNGTQLPVPPFVVGCCLVQSRLWKISEINFKK